MSLISRAADDLIVAEEVSSEAVYRKKYSRPEWPGASSGVTVGIGYDLGQTDEATIRSDWTGRVPAAMLEVMVSASGVTGSPAKALTKKLRPLIDIPWETARAVHSDCVIPRWLARVSKALPNFGNLPPDCKGALLSIAFNRGTSFSTAGARYTEMRAIKAHMAARRFDAIPAEIRKMKRLWPDLAGLRARRDREAKLFESGLRETFKPQSIAALSAAEPPHGQRGFSELQTRLQALGYYEVGEIDDKWGGRTAAAIAAFKNDRQLPGPALPGDALDAELSKAEAEGWKRRIGAERKLAPDDKIAETTAALPAAKQSRLGAAVSAVGAFLMAAFNGIVSFFDDAWNSPMVTWLREFAADNIALILIGVAALAAFMWWQSGRAVAATRADYKEGRLT